MLQKFGNFSVNNFNPLILTHNMEMSTENSVTDEYDKVHIKEEIEEDVIKLEPI